MEALTLARQESKPLNPKSKRAAVLRVFLERGSAGLNCFEAVTLAHDYVLRTTVSECKSYHGIEFLKRFEQVPGHAGSKVECVRYWLSPEGEAKARELLNPATKPERSEISKERWERAVRAAEQERRDRAARGDA
jgi:hypothetical protein